MGSSPLLFEAVPPPRRATSTSVDHLLSRLADHLEKLPRVAAINVPEVLDENHMGRPFYRAMDARDFAVRVQEHTSCDVVVNKVVVHSPSGGAFVRWARESIQRHEIHNMVLVGGSSSLRRYPGPGVIEAAGMISHLFRTLDVEDGLVGSIAIPSRGGEAERLFSKTLAGCRFATTQILFDTESLQGLLLAYERLCRDFDVRPATIVISVAPISDIHDLEFVRWLGAEVPEVVEDRLFHVGAEAAKNQSIQLAVGLWKEILAFRRKHRLSVPLGLNVEQVSHHNLDAAIDMASRLSATLSAD